LNIDFNIVTNGTYGPPQVFMKKITITGKKVLMEDEIEEVSEGIVKRIGNGAMILSSKKYIGKKVYVLMRK
jgi:putative transposon-encoded protein